ncbi:MAG: BBP7 family outer membrane beta-barrel protein [Pirellulales bacterium]|nr:BBP7 family outer membrane beta-barrel protein [Pirellulales bacterium]
MKGPIHYWLLCLTAIALAAGTEGAAAQAPRSRGARPATRQVAPPRSVSGSSFQDALRKTAYQDTPYYEEEPSADLRPVPAETAEEYSALEEGYGEETWYESPPGEGWYEPHCLGCGAADECCTCEWDQFSGCPSPWFATAEAIFTQRQRSRNRIVSRDRADPIQVISGGQIITVANATAVMGTKSVGSFDFEPGFRFTLGRYLGRDMLNRDHTLEFTYFGLLDWSGSARVHNQGGQLIALRGNDTIPAAVGGSLVTDFPTSFPNGNPSVGGFNFATTHYIEYGSHVNNFELNYRLRRALGRDSLVGQSDGSWHRQLTPGHTPSIFGGVRYFELDERFYFFSEALYIPPPPPLNQPVRVQSPQGGEYTIHTRNRLIGAQLGGDLIDEHVRWNWGARGKVGLYANFAEQDSVVWIQAQEAMFTTGNQASGGSDQRLAFIGELGFVANYRWTPNLSFRAAWDMMWVSRLALAPEQLNFTFPQTDSIVTTGGLFFNTFSVGADFSW